MHAASPSRRWTLVQWSESGSQVTRSKRRRRRTTKKMMSSLFTTLNWTSQYRRRCDYVFCDNVIICPKNVVNILFDKYSRSFCIFTLDTKACKIFSDTFLQKVCLLHLFGALYITLQYSVGPVVHLSLFCFFTQPSPVRYAKF